MVIFSGGKEIRGPQSSGLILGKKQWIARVMPIVVHNIALDVQ